VLLECRAIVLHAPEAPRLAPLAPRFA
jgi:hypothetical protein